MNQFKIRLSIVSLLLIILGSFVIGRLFMIQIVEGKRYAARSRNQTQQRTLVRAQRGSILDRNGTVLAVSVPDDFAVKMNALGIDRKGSDPNKTAKVRRVYPLGEVAGPVLGYVGRDGYGLGGAEFAFDAYLRGEDGWTMLQKDGRNRRYKKLGLPQKEPENGADLYLTIDSEIQKIVQTVLRQTVEKLNAKGGMCIVMEPKSGKILAMANEPSFNPNVPSLYPLANRQNQCIESVYEPGSTFKVVTASVALEKKLKKEDDLIFGNNGVFEIYDQKIRDHNPYGYLTFTQALSYSSNVCFAKIASEVSNEDFYQYVRDYGFGVKSDFELPGEESGIVHQVKSWSGRTRVTMAIGHEISVTLLQMLQPFAVIANGGVLIRPRIVGKIIDKDKSVVDSSQYRPIRRVLSEQTARRLRVMMQSVVTEGTGKNAIIDGVPIAGKTGTSQKPDSGSYSNHRYWSSFIGFTPVENPVLLCGVVIDEPAGSEMGGVAAAPAFKRIVSQIISHPDLEFAQEILNQNRNEKECISPKTAQIPVLCGMALSKAKSHLVSSGIAFKVLGSGDTVRYQSLVAGTLDSRNKEVLLFLDSWKSTDSVGIVPDCVGKDLRDAVNLLNLRGLSPFVVGMGMVKKQFPAPGSSVFTARPCTLVCSFQEG